MRAPFVLSLNNALLETDLILSHAKFWIVCCEINQIFISSCADGAEKPSEGCQMTITAGPGLAMSSLMAIIAAILLLICES